MTLRRRVLVSLCNKHRCPEVAPGVALVELDLVSGAARPVAPSLPDGLYGLTGLCRFRGRVFVATQAHVSRAALVELGPESDVEAVHPLSVTRDAHSLLATEDYVFIASTGTDAVTAWSPDTGDFVLETKGSGTTDTLHLNGIATDGDRVYYSAFGPKVNDDWLVTTRGYVRELETDALHSAANHPHSLTLFRDELLWCESNEQRICSRDVGRPHDRGYTRGLAAEEDRLLVGTSVRRAYSRSSGASTGQRETGECGVTVLRGVSLTQLREEAFHSLMAFGREVYDIMFLD